MTQCRAKSKRSGEQCKRKAMANGVCYMHGGAQKRGIEHHLTVTGRYSKHLPTKAIAEFQAAMHDPDLLSMRTDIALIDLRLNELISQSGEDLPDAKTWKEIRAVVHDRRALVETERRRLIDMQQMITGEQAMLLVARLYDSVNRHVRDPLERAAIAADLGSLAVSRGSEGHQD